jgi:cellulose biosynthesis protein BcsQ
MSMVSDFFARLSEGNVDARNFLICAGGLILVLLIGVMTAMSRKRRHRHQVGRLQGRIAELEEAVRQRNAWIDTIKREQGDVNQQRQQALGEVARLREIVQALTNRMESDRNDHSGEMERLKKIEEALNDQLRQAADTRASLQHTITNKDGEVESLRGREQEFTNRLEQAAEEFVGLQTRYKTTEQRMQRVARADGRIWETPVDAGVPGFRPFDSKACPIICVMNLKGGVGKSTISANLGCTLWKQGKKVLLIDLDFQGSLSSLCMRPDVVMRLRQDQRLTQTMFQDQPVNVGRFRSCFERIEPNGNGMLVATDDGLAECEERLMAQWLIGNTSDVRFRLRELVHDDRVQQEFDYIIIDCPPRRTTASVNALAASDFALIPVILDATSTEAAPRLLASLLHMKHDTQVCPNLSILGCIANMVSQASGLNATEKDRWNRLQVRCQDRWGQPVYHFENAIPHRADFGHAAESNQFAVNYNEQIIGGVFRNLAQEVEWRVSAYAGSGVKVFA